MKLLQQVIENPLDIEGYAIPIYGSYEFCYIEWKEDETIIDCFKKMELDVIPDCSFQVKSQDDEEFTFELNAYPIKCFKTGKMFYLISEYIGDPSDMIHAFCVPYNKVNVLIVFKEILLPFADKNFNYP